MDRPRGCRWAIKELKQLRMQSNEENRALAAYYPCSRSVQLGRNHLFIHLRWVRSMIHIDECLANSGRSHNTFKTKPQFFRPKKSPDAISLSLFAFFPKWFQSERYKLIQYVMSRTVFILMQWIINHQLSMLNADCWGPIRDIIDRFFIII